MLLINMKLSTVVNFLIMACYALGDESLNNNDRQLGGEWDIRYQSMAVNFDDEHLESEVVLSYTISDQESQVTIYEGDHCNVTVPVDVIGMQKNYSIVNSTHGGLDVTLDIKQDQVSLSDIWAFNADNSTGYVDVCVRVDLVEPTLGNSSISFNEVDVTLTIDMTKNFTLDGSNVVDLTRQGPVQQDRNSDTSYNLEAFQCDESGTQIADTIKQSSQLFICLVTNSTNIQFSDIKSLSLSQGDLSLTPISNGIVTKNALTYVTGIESQNVAIETKLISAFFEADAPDNVKATGVAIMEFKTAVPSRDRRLAGAGLPTRNLQEGDGRNGFSVEFALGSPKKDPSTAYFRGLVTVVVTGFTLFASVLL